MRKRWFVWVPLVLAVFLLFVSVGGHVVGLLWNWLMPPLFGVPPVTFWQALGLLALGRILFGGFGMHGGSGYHYRRRWEAMTPDERERVRERIRARVRERWGFRPSGTDSQAP
jgi:hypothetical protein